MCRRVKRSRKYYLASSSDLISDLPDDIKSHILSLLPIQEAIRTCVLSKDWEYKWTLISNVTMEEFPFPCSNKVFFKFVEIILFNLKSIRSFHLRCICERKSDLRRVATWISALSKRNIESLEVEISYEREDIEMFKDKYYMLPHSLLNCSSLKNLVLDMPYTFKVSVNNCFPNLTRLFLHGIKILNEYSSTDTLVFSFPVVKEFELYHCEYLNVKFVEIYAPILATFKSSSPDDIRWIKSVNYSIKIIGNKLEEIIVDGGFPENITWAGSTITRADLGSLNYDEEFMSLEEYGLRIQNILRELSHLKCLKLSGYLMYTKDIAQSKRGISFPKFLELEKLYINEANMELLLELLHATPFLKILEINMANWDYSEYDNDAIEFVPSCLISHLEKIELHYAPYYWEPRNIDLPKFLLKSGKHLKHFYVHGDNRSFPADKAVELLTFPKGSSFVKIKVIQ